MKFPTNSREGGCIVCGGPVNFLTASWKDQGEKFAYANECQRCHFLQIIDNPWKYQEVGFTENSISGPRVGSENDPGREYYMAQIGLQGIKKNKGISVFILGSGLSVDFKHITKLPGVGEVWVSDYENFTGCENFIEIKDQGKRVFDLILACEVVEHFEDPKEDWKLLTSNLGPDSVFVLSTNLYDQSPLRTHWYAYIGGHLSYHSGASIQELAKQNGLHVDFRVPLVANQTAGPRKRYVIGSKNANAVRAVSGYFADHQFAPSEDDTRSKGMLHGS